MSSEVIEWGPYFQSGRAWLKAKMPVGKGRLHSGEDTKKRDLNYLS
jgi:hypothetical protein